MAESQQPASNNPFRRRGGGGGSSSGPPPPAADAFDAGLLFRERLRALPRSSEAPPSTTFQKPKPVKHVRVQSPPPSSPESAAADGFPDALAATAAADDSSTSASDLDADADADAEDPFQAAAELAPPNPFQQPPPPEDQPPKDAAKAPLDVDSFRRLLLTGRAAPAQQQQQQQQPPPPPAQPDAASMTDASSVSKQSIFDAAPPPLDTTPRTSHELSDAEDDHGRLAAAVASQPSPQRTTPLRRPRARATAS